MGEQDRHSHAQHGNKKPRLYRADGTEYEFCPGGLFKDPEIREAFRLWNWMQQGFLPYSGGMFDQPEQVLRQIETVNMAHAEWTEKKWPKTR